MSWQTTDSGIWTLALSGGMVTITVFKPNYDRQHWHFAINDKDNSEGFGSLQGAKEAGLRVAITQINGTLKHLSQAKEEAEALQAQERHAAVELER